MTDITRAAIDGGLPSVFSPAELKKAVPGCLVTSSRLSRAVSLGEIERVFRGLYILGKPYRKDLIDVYYMSGRIDPGSYVSMMSALSVAGWIPEAVYICQCVSTRPSVKRSCRISSSVATISYSRLYLKDPLAGTFTANCFGEDFRMAGPVKALCDWHAHVGCGETNAPALMESLRIDLDDAREAVTTGDFKVLDGVYRRYALTERFLGSLADALL